jgi:hypothetical protein
MRLSFGSGGLQEETLAIATARDLFAPQAMTDRS